jgi:hypothetical protein
MRRLAEASGHKPQINSARETNKMMIPRMRRVLRIAMR